ncbi:MAG: MBL fold metallo-hydrolase [Bacteroidales bacterium]|nr:MBL fold metallo-hydrolase [Bacteroidales bacterium]MDD2424536.1 MBL fold metallo-hydrolase [Bacteroidales bacterium]MDD3988482.1 MBL fold metallo-hydrolase [Bacteroidales bacterium]
MIRFASLSSGSNGNCYCIANDKTTIIIDAGIGFRTLKKRLSEIGVAVKDISFILVTHDHIDHIKHLGSIAFRNSIPVIATPAVHKSLDYHPCTAGFLSGLVQEVIPGENYEKEGVEFIPFSVPHDATETVGYHIDFFGERFTIVTDIGRITEDVIRYSRMANHLVFEANYDMNMLMDGEYPRYLKERIRGGNGHLSNDQTALALSRICHPELRNIFMCHLSEKNNDPGVAYKTVSGYLNKSGINIKDNLNIECLPRQTLFYKEI